MKELNTNNIFLIGFMGTGKSTISECLSRMCGWEILEMDQQIVKREGKSIPAIFEEAGEAYFRKLETELLMEMRLKQNMIVSCGGGVPMRSGNVEEMKRNGSIVLLTAKPDTILERVCKNEERPLLAGHMNAEYIEKLMEERRERYEAAADFRVVTDHKSAEEISTEILKRIQEMGERDV